MLLREILCGKDVSEVSFPFVSLLAVIREHFQMTNFRKGLLKRTETVSWNDALEFAERKWTGADGVVFGILMCNAAVNYNWIGCHSFWRHRNLWKVNIR
jgi:hypothetical protein